VIAGADVVSHAHVYATAEANLTINSKQLVISSDVNKTTNVKTKTKTKTKEDKTTTKTATSRLFSSLPCGAGSN